MDRDKRWDRVKVAYDLLVEGKGEQARDMVAAMQEKLRQRCDRRIHQAPSTTLTSTVLIKEGDVVIFFNYRNDRAKELTVVLTQHDMPEEGMHTIPAFSIIA